MIIRTEEIETLTLQVITKRAVEMFACSKAPYQKETLSSACQTKKIASSLMALRTYRDGGRRGQVSLLVDDANDLAYRWIEKTCDLSPTQEKSVDVEML